MARHYEIPADFSCIRDLTLCVRHHVEEIEVEQVTFAVTSKVTFPIADETRRVGDLFLPVLPCRLATNLQKHAYQPLWKGLPHRQITAMTGNLP